MNGPAPASPQPPPPAVMVLMVQIGDGWFTEAIAPQAQVFVLALPLPPQLPRPQAREQLRSALLQVLARRLNLPLASLRIPLTPGQPPRLQGPAPCASIGLSFSHEAGLSLAAVNLQGPIGIDVLRDETPPDWSAVARDYLGPQAHARLLAQGGVGFAQAWAAHEAQLKLRAQALREWSPAPAPGEQPQPRIQALALPAPWVACVALPPSGEGRG